MDDERLEQLQGHVLRQTTLIKVELRANDDNRTAGVVHALTQQVLTETALLALEHVSERFQRALLSCRSRHRGLTNLHSIINQGVHGFLQHAFFVLGDNLRSLQFYEMLERS